MYYPLMLFSFICFSFSCLHISADEWVKSYTTSYEIGPEIYDVHRTKKGGGEQKGVMYGVRINMDRVKRYKYYWGADFLWAKGTLHGNGTGSRLKSTLTDENIEARFGYTFGAKRWRCASITPFVGLGYFIEKNHYEHPSPLKVHFKNTFGYVPVGFLSQVFIFPNLSVGCNFKVRFLFDAINKVSNDPDYKSFYQNYEQKLQYRVEIPIDYFFTYLDKPFGISLAPFYEYRSYGHSVNFPFDFIETNFRLSGAALKLMVLF